MSRCQALARRLFLLFTMAAGCGEAATPEPPPAPAASSPAQPPPAPAPTTPTPTPTAPPREQPTTAQLVDDVNEHLARLNKLEIVQLSNLVLNVPDEARHCYGPCLDEPAVASEYARQAPRLARLTQLAEQAAASPTVVPVDPAAVAPDLEALRALQIVGILGLQKAAPASSPRCYNLPCREDLQAADAENQRRAGVVRDLARAAAAERL